MAERIRFGVITGTGLYDVFEGERISIDTPYGKSPEIMITEIEGRKIAFMPRHGREHAAPPHRINYRANIYALKELGVERIIATNAVGSLRREFEPGSYVLVDDFIDLTKTRPSTFYEDRVIHVDMTQPYCPEIRKAVLSVARKIGAPMHDGGVYVCTEGPRFETRAEIRMIRQMGGDVVGMTGVPEVVLARELEMCYATICIVTNYAADMAERLTVDEVFEIMGRKKTELRELIVNAILNIPEERNCICARALEGAVVK